MFLGLLDPNTDPLAKGTDPDPDPSRKTLIPTDFLLLNDFLSLKNDVNVTSKNQYAAKLF